MIRTLLATALVVAAPAMATQQSKTQCETLLADNTSGDISPEDLRDCTTESVLFLDGSSNVDLVINEDGDPLDVRAEGSSDTHLLFIDGSADAIGISDSTPTASKLTLGLDVDFETDATRDIGTASSRAATVYTTELLADDSGSAVTIPAIDNDGSNIVFSDDIDLSGAAGLQIVTDADASCPEASLKYFGSSTGVMVTPQGASVCFNNNQYAIFNTTGFIFNDAGSPNFDFRVETDTQTNALFVDAGLEQVDFGVNLRLTNHYLTAGDPGCSVAGDVGRIAMFDNAADQVRACVCEQTAASTYSWQDLGGGTTCSGF